MFNQRRNVMRHFCCGVVLGLHLLCLCWTGEVVNDKQLTEPQTTITFPGKIESVLTVKAIVNQKEVDINIVNGLLPDEIMEGTEKGSITRRLFNFGEKPSTYDKTKKYEYTFTKQGPSVIESVGDDVVSEYTTRIYKLKDQ
jgi:hypothetical protein